MKLSKIALAFALILASNFASAQTLSESSVPGGTCAPPTAAIIKSSTGFSIQYDAAEFNKGYVALVAGEKAAGRVAPTVEQVKSQIQAIAKQKMGALGLPGKGTPAEITVTLSCSFRPLHCTLTINL